MTKKAKNKRFRAYKKPVASKKPLNIKEHAKRLPLVKGRHIPIKLAGALYVILGIISVLSGLVMIYLSFLSAGFITAFADILMQGNLAVFLIGITSVSLGVMEFLIGFGIWRLHRWAGTLGLIMAVVTVVLSVPYSMLNQFSGTLSFILSLILIILIYYGRRELVGADFQ